jgi:hypothetical protein
LTEDSGHVVHDRVIALPAVPVVHDVPVHAATAHCHRVVHADEQHRAVEVLPLDHGLLVGSCLRTKNSPSYTLARCRLPTPGTDMVRRWRHCRSRPVASIPGTAHRRRGSWPPSAGRWRRMAAGTRRRL